MKNSLFALIAFLGILLFSNNLTNAQTNDCCNDKTASCCTESTACCTTGESGSQLEDPKKDALTREAIPEGKAIEFSYLGKSYYFASEENLAKFKAEPIDYAKDLTCPIMGDAASKETFVEHNGTKYYLCCEMCVKKFNKKPRGLY
jgi:YHS domain-containing protein